MNPTTSDDLTVPVGWHPMMVHPTYPNASTGPYPFVSTRMADMVKGDHDLRVFDHRRDERYANHRRMLGTDAESSNRALVSPFYDHAQYLATLVALLDATYKLGEVEHTSDWDWYLGIQTRDGVWHGDDVLVNPDQNIDIDPPEEETYCDTMTLPEAWTHQFTPMHDHGSLPVELQYWVNPTHDMIPHFVFLRDIAVIHISER